MHEKHQCRKYLTKMVIMNLFSYVWTTQKLVSTWKLYWEKLFPSKTITYRDFKSISIRYCTTLLFFQHSYLCIYFRNVCFVQFILLQNVSKIEQINILRQQRLNKSVKSRTASNSWNLNDNKNNNGYRKLG